MRSISIRTAMTGEWERIGDILHRTGLMATDVDPFETMFHVAESESMLVGCAGAERLGNTAIVGPVAVLPEFRDRGIASHLIRTTLMRARASGCRQAVYFSHHCAVFFSRHGFLLMPRDELSPEVRASKTFQREHGFWSLCMRCDLT
ncbi:GNAT family N-acetyltransferase [Cupriavidus pinatubonensis]|uniref:N-acetyltransferase domain-containing protein n=1 Tax=Cupriavidus pinatubonensis TaxID=248026 RepID=A0ABM8WYP4_9BURK|nr:GNAT family N-acetyltransferase [Cupriavidus pinatubonensis]CAG9172617.1 hypothetical protein LMG23994_02450 [Cupriavidus pinatubonensis]